jgi:hypothetical protein
MKIIVTESQYRLLSEQSDYAMDRRGNALLNATGIRSDKDYKKVNQIISNAQKSMGNADPHVVLAILGIGAAFIPVAGPFISLGIGLLDSGLYYKEGDKTSAGISAVFSLLPFVGKIPGVKETSSAVWKAIASKMASGAVLAKAESELVKQVASNAGSIQTLVSSASKKLSPLVKQITELKPEYIKRYGQEAYEKLMRDFISGVSDQDYFLQTLKAGQKAAPELANFVTRFGIKFGPAEVEQIHKIAAQVFDDDTVKQVFLNSKTGPRTIKVYTVPRSLVVQKLPASADASMFADTAGNAVYIIKDNIKNLSPKNIKDFLTHEFAHIKDPSTVKSPAYIKKYATEALEGMKNWAIADDLTRLGLKDKSQTFLNKAIQQYYLNPNEIIANNTMVLQNFATNSKNLGNIMNKNELIKGLDGVINWSKGSVVSWTDDVSRLLGYYDQTISNHFKYLSQNPVEYRKFLAKLAQQAEYLKSQVKIAM